MTGITSAISDLISSILGIFTNVFSTLFAGVEGVFATFGTLLTSVFDLLQGFIGFVLGNLFILGILAVGLMGYVVYSQRKGKSIKTS